AARGWVERLGWRPGHASAAARRGRCRARRRRRGGGARRRWPGLQPQASQLAACPRRVVAVGVAAILTVDQPEVVLLPRRLHHGRRQGGLRSHGGGGGGGLGGGAR